MLKTLKKTINLQKNTQEAQRNEKEQSEINLKFSVIENEILSYEEKEKIDLLDQKIELHLKERENFLKKERKNINVIAQEVVIKEEGFDSWKVYGEEIVNSLELVSAVDDIQWPEQNTNNLVAIIEGQNPLVNNSFFQDLEFELIEDVILEKFSFIKHENLEIKLNKHHDKENISIKLRLLDSKEMIMLYKMLPSLIQAIGLNLIADFLKLKSDNLSCKIVLRGAQQKTKKKLDREAYA